MTLMERRMALMAALESGSRGLPFEYQEVEYLTSADNKANRYVNTQIIYNDVALITMRYSKETARSGIIIATYDNGLTTPFGEMTNDVGGRGWMCSPTIAKGTTADNSDLTFTRTKNGTGTIALMGWHNASYVPRGKLYSAAFFDSNNVKIGDFVPCYRKTDTVIGLYDIINNRFCQQTGGIGKGPDVQ